MIHPIWFHPQHLNMTQQNKNSCCVCSRSSSTTSKFNVGLHETKKIKNAVILKHGDKTQFYPQRPFPKTEKRSTDNQMYVLGISARKQLLIPRWIRSWVHQLTKQKVLLRQELLKQHPANKSIYCNDQVLLTYGFCVIVKSLVVVLLSIVCVPLFLEGFRFPGKEKKSHITILQGWPL